MTEIEIWITEEQDEMMRALYEVGKAPNAEPYGDRTRRGGLVCIVYKADDEDVQTFELLWGHRHRFGWKTRNDMHVDVLVKGASIASDRLRRD